MKASSARKRRSRKTSGRRLQERSTLDGVQTGLRIAIVSTLEALEEGDSRLAVEILLAALEADGEYVVRCHCRFCGASFQWPGELDHHRRFAHGLDMEAQRAA